MSEIQLLYGDGEAKVCKTSVMSIAADTLRDEQGMDVQRAEAGTFFRRVTVATLEELLRLRIDEPTDNDLRSASAEVIAAGTLYDENRVWDLHSPKVDYMVGTISHAAHVQQASLDWWTKTADMALANGKDVLIVDGRNPRDRLAIWAQQHRLAPLLELLCVCDPKIAAERTLAGRGQMSFTDEDCEREKSAIIRRRQQDRERSDFPYHDPEVYVPLALEDAEGTFREALDRNGDGIVVPIRVDTGILDWHPMRRVVRSLVLAAIQQSGDQS